MFQTIHNGSGNGYTAVPMEDYNSPDTVDAIGDNRLQGNQLPKPTQAAKSSKKTVMHNAAETGQVDELKKLLKTHPDLVSVSDERGRKPLHLAANGLHRLCCQILLESNDKIINNKDKNGYTPLLLSISTGDTSFDTIQLLLDYSANARVMANGKRTALHIAAEKGNISIIEKLLGVQGIDINAADADAKTALHLAAKNGHIEACKVLESAGANKEAQDNQGRTPLYWASKRGFYECVKLLLSLDCNANSRDNKGDTPLHAFCGSHIERTGCAELLFKYKANPNAQNNDGKTPFHLIQRSKREVKEIFKTLSVDLLITDKKGKTALHYVASIRNSCDHIKFILGMDAMKNIEDKTAFINAKDMDGYTAFHSAAEQGELESCKTLLKAGADCNVHNNMKGTALHLAAEKGFSNVCEFLIEKGVKVNTKNNDSLTPLHLAAEKGHNECCEALMKKGAKALECDDKDNTVLHSAVSGGHVTCIEAIRDKEPSLVNRSNKEGKTPLHMAVEKGSLECCKALIIPKTDLWARSSIYNKSPVCVAYDNESYEIFDYFLTVNHKDQHRQDQLKKDIDFRVLLREALQQSKRKVVTTIVESVYWEESLHPYYSPEKKQTADAASPTENSVPPKVNENYEMKNQNLRNLVVMYPDLAEKIFDKCLPNQGQEETTATTSVDDPITHCYKIQYIDEICKQKDVEYKDESKDLLPPPPIAKDLFDQETWKLKSGVDTNPVNYEWRHDHVLTCVVNERNKKLLTHPLVNRWVKYKWNHYIRFGYYVTLVLAFLHAVLLTIFSLISWDWREMYDKYQLNQTAICMFNTSLVGPEVVHLLQTDSQRPNAVTYAIYAIMGVWCLHGIYKLIKTRTLRMDGFLTLMCIVANILFLVNFTKCSQVTFVREDWQWVVGPFALTLAWLYCLNLASCHLYYKPMFFSFRSFLTAARDIIVPITPIFLIGFLFHRLTPKGSLTLESDMNWFFSTFHEMPSTGSLIILVLVAIVFLAQIRSEKENQKKGYDWRRAMMAINMILDFDLLYPFLRKRFYVARISVDKRGRSIGCCNRVKTWLPFVQKIKDDDLDYITHSKDKQALDDLIIGFQGNLSKLNFFMLESQNKKINKDSQGETVHSSFMEHHLLVAEVQSDISKMLSLTTKYGRSKFRDVFE